MSEIKYDHNEIIVNMLKNAYVEKNSDVKADLFFELIYGIGTMIKSEEKTTKREEFIEEVNNILTYVLNELDEEFPNASI
jgi:hypothetical protein